jgi:glycosyltransferase involved in cell wall biosynthesis
VSAPERPGVSVVIPAYNAGAHLEKLLASLEAQTYPRERLELIVVDDDSSDDTRGVAERHGARVLRNGARHIERGKAIGLAAATHDLVLFLDADNYLTRRDWLEQAVAPLVADESLTGAQSIRFHYDRRDPAANRYCALFGINDPLAFYLGRRDRLTAAEAEWRLLGKVEDRGGHYLGTFRPDAVPTLGSQGFLTRKRLLLTVPHDPYLFHMEANLELIRQGHDRYVLLKADIGHDHVTTAAGFVAKCRRNIELFHRWSSLRTYRWETPAWRLALTALAMVTLVRPLWDAWHGYRRVPDPAWFLHVWFCLAVPLVYAGVTLKWRWRPRAAAAV